MDLKEQATSLYKTVFHEDGEDFAKTFTDKYFDDCCRYTVCDGKMVAMLYLLDCSVSSGQNRFSAYYLYAAATHPDYRGKGLMSSLINSVLEEGKIVITRPATKELFAFYEKFGFSVCSFKDKTEKEFASEDRLGINEYIKLRKKLLKNIPHIILTDQEFALGGLALYGNDTYCAAVDLETSIVKEYINHDVFRGTTPFAMWTAKNDKPVYFGIAMD